MVALVKGDGEVARSLLHAASFDSDAIVEFAARHQIGGYLHVRLSELAADRSGAEDVVAKLQAMRTKQIKKSASDAGNLAQLAERFLQVGCDFILLKGLYLAERFYGAANLRTSWDIDLLVERGEREVAREVLEGAGFSLVEARDRTRESIEFLDESFVRMREAGGPPPLGLHLVLGPAFPEILARARVDLAAGRMAPTILWARKNGEGEEA